MTTPKVHQITAVENAWIGEQFRRAQDFVKRYAKANEVTIETLDQAWQQWIATNENDVDRVNEIINAVGIAFGMALAGATPLKWVIASDEQSSELALFAFPGKGDLLIFPANLVAKRWEKREAVFIPAVYNAIIAQVQRIGALQQQADEPWWKRVLMGHGDRS